MPHINELSNNILSKILLEAFQGGVALARTTPTPRSRYLISTALLGSKTCTRWCSIINRLPTLWVIRMVFGLDQREDDSDCESLAQPINVYQRWLESSQECLLDIYFEDFRSYLVGQGEDCLKASLDLILPYQHRWRAVDAAQLSPCHAADLLWKMTSIHNVSHLRCMSLGYPGWFRSVVSSEIPLYRSLQLIAYNLESLYLGGVQKDWENVSIFPNLMELRIEIANYQGHSIWNTIYIIIARAPRLSHLTLTIAQSSQLVLGTNGEDVESRHTSPRVFLPALRRMELTLELDDVVSLLCKIETPELQALHITCIRVAPRPCDISWPPFQTCIPKLRTLSLCHIELGDAVAFLTCFELPLLRHLDVIFSIAERDQRYTHHITASSLVKFLEKTAKMWSVATLSLVSLFKGSVQVLEAMPRVVAAQLPSLISARLYPAFPNTHKAFLSEFDMPCLKTLDVVTRHSMGFMCFQQEYAIERPVVVELPSLSFLKIDTLDQADLIPCVDVASPESHLYVRDPLGNPNFGWPQFCGQYHDFLRYFRSLTLHVTCDWRNYQNAFACFHNVSSLTLIFRSHSLGILELLHAPIRYLSTELPFPKLSSLTLQLCDKGCELPARRLLSSRKGAAAPIHTLRIVPFLGDQRDHLWFIKEVEQFITS